MPPARADIRALADEELADQPHHRRELFGLRLDRWWDDLHEGWSQCTSRTRSTVCSCG